MDTAHALTAEEARPADTFQALMRALSCPGSVHHMPGGDPFLIAEALIDREVGFHAVDAALVARIAALGAAEMPRDAADFVFAAAAGDLPGGLATGTRADPDGGATLIAPARLGTGLRLRLAGPGIAGERTVEVDGIAPAFWTARAAALRYPLGFDMFVHDGTAVIGLPRSTTVEVA